jgi:carbon-monoxide dehydrogenase small subunit
MQIEFVLNNREIRLETAPDRRVVDILREELGLTGTKESCGSGECGACTILVDGESRLSCLMLAIQLQGRRLTTIEGLGPVDGLHPIQEAFVEQGAVQCGFCTPGMVLAAHDLLGRQAHPDRQQIREGLSGNICRCTGYQKVVDAVQAVCRLKEDQRP